MTEPQTAAQTDIRIKGKLPLFGLPRFGTSLILNFRDFVTFFLYTEVFALSGIYTGLATALGFVAIAASQFLMSAISDRINTRWGRRRPFVLFGTPVLAISFFLLFTPLLFLGKNPPELDLFVWLIVWKCMFEFFYGFVTSPYQAMMPEVMTVNERPKGSQWQNFFGMIGQGTGIVITLLVLPPITDQIVISRELSTPFLTIFLVGAIITVVLFLIFTRVFKKEEPRFMARRKFRENMSELWKNKNYLHVTLFQGIVSLAWAMIFGVILVFIKDVLHFTTTIYYIAAVALLLGILIFLLMWRKFIEKRGKKWTLQVILLIGIVLFPLSLIGIVQGGPDLSGMGIFLVVVVACTLGGWYLFPYLLYADLTEDDARQTDNFKAGVITGFPSVPLNIFQGISYIITGAMRDLLPILPGTTGGALGLGVSWFYVIWGPLASVYLILGLLYLRKRVVLDFAWEKEVKAQRLFV